MTAPDSPAVARVRQMAALSREAANDPDLGEEAAYLDMGADADALDGVLAELAQAQALAENWRVIAQANRIGTAERDRRAALDRPESPQTPSGQCETAAGPSGPQRGVQSRESLPYGVPCPAVGALLRACDENERHIRANVPHLPPDGGTFSVHAIRGIIARAEPACVAAETVARQSATQDGSGAVCDDLGPIPAPTERLRSAADELDRDGRWGAAADATTALAAWMRAEADRPERRAWDDQVLHLAADLADHILRGTT